MCSIRNRPNCRKKSRLGAVLLGAAILFGVSAGDARGHDPKPSSQETSLDRALRELDGSGSKSEPPSTSHPHSHSHAHGSEPVAETKSGTLQSFRASWSLFRNSYLVGWLVGLLLALVGVIVVARDQVFIGAAVSQASTLGIALALCASTVFPVHSDNSILSHSATWLCCDSFQVLMAVAFSVLAALVTSRAERTRRESHEAITGWVFLISASLSVLVVAHSPHGLEEIRRMHSSSIIGATSADVGMFAVLLVVTILFILVTHQRLLLFVMDPPMAAAVGMKVGRWAVFESLWLGLVVGLSIRASGMLFTFGSLVLPALVAKNVCREVRPMFLVAPAVALLTNTVGFMLANRYDFPPAQMNVALLGCLLLVVWLLKGAWRLIPQGA